jgi:hypothetical protein
MTCRHYELDTWLQVPRPLTQVVKYPEEETKIINFLRENGFCILKPDNKPRGEGIALLKTPSQLREISSGTYVIQKLVPSIHYNGKKITFRAYVIISDLKVPKYLVPSFIIVKSAPLPYKEGVQESEIASTSYA